MGNPQEMACENWHLGRILLSAAPNLLSLYNGHFFSKSRVCICKHFVNKLPSPAVRRCNSFCFYGIAAAMGLRHTNGNIGVTISNIRPECFSFSLPLLQFQKRFLASSANKAFAINRPVRFSPLLRPDLGELAKPDTKNGQDFRLAQSAQAISSSLFNLNTSQMSLIRTTPICSCRPDA